MLYYRFALDALDVNQEARHRINKKEGDTVTQASNH
jgi:hypothetical protein